MIDRNLLDDYEKMIADFDAKCEKIVSHAKNQIDEIRSSAIEQIEKEQENLKKKFNSLNKDLSADSFEDTSVVGIQIDFIYEYFVRAGFDVIDKRSNGGALWVIGNESEIEPHLIAIENIVGEIGEPGVQQGYAFGKAADGRYAWWTKCRKDITLRETQQAELDEDQVQYSIAFEDFVVRSNTFKCNHNHNFEALQAMISVLKHNGKVVSQIISAGYCRQCNCYFILESDYQNLRVQGVPLCRQITEKTYREKGLATFTGEELNPESLLHSVGYNVNATEDLTSKQRQDILSFVVESGLYTVSGVCSHLDWLIDKNMKVTNRDMSAAISKWVEDRNYINNYKIGTRPMIGIRSIKGRSVR